MTHKEALMARFPHFLDLFLYDINGRMCHLNEDFVWSKWDARTLTWYICELSLDSERTNINKYANAHEFVQTIRSLLRILKNWSFFFPV